MIPFPLSPLGADARPPLPYDAEVDYLESTGTQILDTGVPVTDQLYCRIEFAAKNTSSNKHVISSSKNTNTFAVVPTVTSGRQIIRLLNRLSTADSNTIVWQSFQKISFEFDNRTAPAHMTVDGVVKNVTDGTGSNGSRDIVIFGKYHQSLDAYDCASYKIYSCAIIAGSKSVDLIPVRVGSVGYMFDRVSGQLLGNSGTGSFVIGPDK